MGKIRFRTGLAIPCSGIYLVHHKQHRLPHEVTLLQGQVFPTCARCTHAVWFELVMGITDEALVPPGFRVVLHQIPELADDAKEKKIAAGEKAS